MVVACFLILLNHHQLCERKWLKRKPGWNTCLSQLTYFPFPDPNICLWILSTLPKPSRFAPFASVDSDLCNLPQFEANAKRLSRKETLVWSVGVGLIWTGKEEMVDAEGDRGEGFSKVVDASYWRQETYSELGLASRYKLITAPQLIY